MKCDNLITVLITNYFNQLTIKVFINTAWLISHMSFSRKWAKVDIIQVKMVSGTRFLVESVQYRGVSIIYIEFLLRIVGTKK